MSKPIVSVIIPSYNHAQFIGEAIQSVLNSSLRQLELIIVDDGSKDSSSRIINSFRDKRIKFLEQKNKGAHSAINLGAKIAEAPWISILNSDDKFHSQKLSTHLSIHLKYPNFDASVTRAKQIGADGKYLEPSNTFEKWYDWSKKAYHKKHSLFQSLLVSNHLLTTSALFIKRHKFIELGGFQPLHFTHDWFLFLSLSAENNLFLIDSPLVKYRRHQFNTISQNRQLFITETNFLIEWHLGVTYKNKQNILRNIFNHVLVNKNSLISWELIFLFQKWRLFCKNDFKKSIEIFSKPENSNLLNKALILASKNNNKKHKNFFKLLYIWHYIIGLNYSHSSDHSRIE